MMKLSHLGAAALLIAAATIPLVATPASAVVCSAAFPPPPPVKLESLAVGATKTFHLFGGPVTYQVLSLVGNAKITTYNLVTSCTTTFCSDTSDAVLKQCSAANGHHIVEVVGASSPTGTVQYLFRTA